MCAVLNIEAYLLHTAARSWLTARSNLQAAITKPSALMLAGDNTTGGTCIAEADLFCQPLQPEALFAIHLHICVHSVAALLDTVVVSLAVWSC